MAKSLAEQIAMLSDEERAAVFEGYTEEMYENLQYDADFWLRPEQQITGDEWYITALIAGRGFGKAQNVSTPIPTPTGWTTLGAIKTGDKVFDEMGNITTVVEAHDSFISSKMYRFTFCDGTYVDSDSEHLWTTWTHSDRKAYNRRNEYIETGDNSNGLPDNWPTWSKKTRWGYPTGVGPKTRTTQEIVDTFTYGTRGELNHSIPVTKPVQYPRKDLIIDPYVFGVWLGDGSASNAQISSHNDEAFWMSKELLDRGYPSTITARSDTNCSILNVLNLRTNLRKQGSLGTKKIPVEYLQGSEKQRRDLLAGLLDTDGFTDPRTNYIEFCAKRKEHADAVMELARSLGQKPRMYIGRATLNGVDHGEKYRVQWRPTENFFYMPRKRDAHTPLKAQASRSMHRMIKSYELLEGVEVRCLTVDSPNHLFLIGEGMIPTHNTLTASQWIRKKAMENPGCRIAVGGRTVGDVRRVMVKGESGILAVHPEADRPEYKSSEATLYWPNGSIAELHSSESPDAARGPAYHFCVGDEFAAWKNDVDSSGATLYSNLIAATRLGDKPQILLATTPKRTPVMKDLMERAKDPEEMIRIVTGSTLDNTSLSGHYVNSLLRQYGDSDLAKQEIEGKMLDESEGIVFTSEMIEAAEELPRPNRLPLRFIAVDPSVSANPDTSDECGIMAIGSTVDRDLTQRKAYVLEDASVRATPDVWAEIVVQKAKEYRTKFVVVEKNQGGDLLRMVLVAKDPTLKVMTVTATKGKLKRAEPVVIAMQQGRVGLTDWFPDLRDQLLFYDPDQSGYSPDRMDAFVWGITAALIEPPEGLRVAGSRITTGVNRKIPTTGRGTGRNRVHGPLRNNRRR